MTLKCKFFQFISAAAESPTIIPKKMELTRENLTALLGAGSFKQKTPSTFSRGSAQTSGGRGPGREKICCYALNDRDFFDLHSNCSKV